MPFLRKLVRKEFCFCISLTSGCIIISFYTLFFGFLNAGTTVDEVIYKNTSKTDVYAKWFNVFHIALMIAAAVILLISVMTDSFRLDGHVHHSYDILLHHLQCFDKCSQSVF
ncbi:uncharacterized protein LOC120449634 isoform X2 [Drosophila santomea]|uniref:uncharacterized protein LOC120449634 isoform X2 n=1 Tax=Drosophila santomea TaxID=129105 RepID=UPI001954ED04|nr:uncharacterized protein LOC120449634 isoform X2 [Drosophila santomea]